MKQKSLVGGILSIICASVLLFSGIGSLFVYYLAAVMSTSISIFIGIWQPIVFDIFAGVLVLVGGIFDYSKPKRGGIYVAVGTGIVLLGIALRLVFKDEFSRGLAMGFGFFWFAAFALGLVGAILSFVKIKDVPDRKPTPEPPMTPPASPMAPPPPGFVPPPRGMQPPPPMMTPPPPARMPLPDHPEKKE